MNSPSSRLWSNPPPPGTEDDEVPSPPSLTCVQSPPRGRREDDEPDPSKVRTIDRIDPYVKSPEYIEYERRSRKRSHSRSRSRERRDRRRSSRSRSRDRRRRSRSHRRRHHSRSSSRSRSRSRSRGRYSRSKRDRRHRRSRSRSQSCNRSASRKARHHANNPPNELLETNAPKVDVKEEMEEEEDSTAKENAFKNDGSFLEMFKKMQEQKAVEAGAKQADEAGTSTKRQLPAFGKRRGGRVLKTGLVEKPKTGTGDGEATPQDVWSIYMNEVKRYKEACCDDDSRTRPLVK